MSRLVCGDSERFIRAILSPDFDDGVLKSTFLSGKKPSVNRLIITDVNESISIFRHKLEKPNVQLLAYAMFGHLELKENTSKYVAKNKDLKRQNFTIQVEEDGKGDNPGHAEIMPKVPEGLANHLYDIKDFFDIRNTDGSQYKDPPSTDVAG